jgi:hypothetical protein
MMFLLVSPLQETEAGEPSASTATASSIQFGQFGKILDSTSNNLIFYVHICSSTNEHETKYGDQGKPREQVAAKPRPTTASGATFAREQADFTAAQTACQISVDDCCE